VADPGATSTANDRAGEPSGCTAQAGTDRGTAGHQGLPVQVPEEAAALGQLFPALLGEAAHELLALGGLGLWSHPLLHPLPPSGEGIFQPAPGEGLCQVSHGYSPTSL